MYNSNQIDFQKNQQEPKYQTVQNNNWIEFGVLFFLSAFNLVWMNSLYVELSLVKINYWKWIKNQLVARWYDDDDDDMWWIAVYS